MTTISGRTTSAQTVTLERKIKFSGDQIANPDFDVIKGKGRFVGFALLEKTNEPDPVLLLGGRLEGGTTADPSKPVELLLPYNTGSLILDDHSLPAGDYTLYLITDGSPATVKLRLKGLSGSAKVHPRAERRFQLKTLEESVAYPQGSPLYSAGGAGRLSSQGILFHALDVRSDAWVGGQNGYCLFPHDDSERPAAVKYAPYCGQPGGSQFIDAFVTPEPTRRIYYGATFPISSGAWDMSVWHNAAAAIRSTEAFGFWLSL